MFLYLYEKRTVTVTDLKTYWYSDIYNKKNCRS